MTDVYGADADGHPRSRTTGGIDPNLRRVLEAAELAVATLDTEGHVVSATAAFAAHWNRSVGDTIGVHLVGLCPEHQRAEITTTLVRMVEGASEIEIVDSRSTAADGRSKVSRMTIGRLTDDSGRTVSLACTITDVTDAHRSLRRPTTIELVRPTRLDPGAAMPDATTLQPLLSVAARRSARTGRPLALLQCEISGLARVPEGSHDQLLELQAERIVNRLRPSDTVCRTTPHTFMVLAEDLGDEQDAVGVAYRLLSTAVEPLCTDDGEFGTDMTIGVVVADGATSPRSVLDATAATLEDARADGVGGFRMVDLRPGMAA